MSEDESLDMQDIQRFIAESDLPAELKKRLNESLPMLLENVGDAAKTVYDPNAIWLEAIQYADYVQQHLQHLQECKEEVCLNESIQTAVAFTRQFKQMAEHAMMVLDTLKIESDLVDWNTVKITYRKDDDAQQ
jgi:cation transport regulator ChaB